MSYIFIGLTEDMEERVVIFNEEKVWKDLSKSAPGNPVHDELLYRTAISELERLSEIITKKIEKLIVES